MKKIIEKMNGWSVKKRLAISIGLIIMLMILIMVGCESDDVTTEEPTTDTTVQEEQIVDETEAIVEEESTIPEDAQGTYKLAYMESDDLKLTPDDFYLLETYGGLTKENSEAFKTSNIILTSRTDENVGLYTCGDVELLITCTEYPNVKIPGSEDYDIFIKVLDNNNIEISYNGLKLHYEK